MQKYYRLSHCEVENKNGEIAERDVGSAARSGAAQSSGLNLEERRDWTAAADGRRRPAAGPTKPR